MTVADDLLAEYRQKSGMPATDVTGDLQTAPISQAQQLLTEFSATRPPSPQPPGLMERAADIFTGELRQTPETEALPELAAARGITTGRFIDDLQTAAGLMFASSDEAKKDIVRSNFPEVEITEDKKGTTILTFPDGKKAVLNKPGLSFQDVLGVVGDMVAFFGPAKLAGLGKGLVSRLAIGAGAEAATEGALQKGVQALGSEQPVSPIDVAAAGLTGMAGEAGGAAIEALRRRGAAKTLGTQMAPAGAGIPPVPPSAGAVSPSSIPPETPFVSRLLEDVARGKEISEKTGIPLYRAQQTMDPTDLDRQSYVSMLSGASRVAADALRKQNKKSHDAVVDFLATVAPEQQIAGAAARARSAAEMVVDAQKELRKETAGPFYKEAFKNKTRYEPRATRDLIQQKMVDAGTDSPLEKSMKRVMRFLEPKGTEAQIAEGLTIKQLHEAKRSLDGMIGRAVKSGDNPLARDLIETKKSLIEEMRTFSPNYDAGRRKFAAQSPAVEALENSLIGRVAGLKDIQLKQVTSTIFDPADVGTSIPNVKNAKKAIQSVDPGAWNDVVRLELEKRLSAARNSLEQVGETTANVPGFLHRSLFGQKKKRDILYAALDNEQKKNLRYIEEGLKRASLGRPGGSPTETRRRFAKEISGIAGSFGRIFRPLRGAARAGEEFNFNKNAFALGSIMFDPKWRPDMRKLRRFKPDSPESAAMFSDMMTKAAKDFRKPAAQALRPETTD